MRRTTKRSSTALAAGIVALVGVCAAACPSPAGAQDAAAAARVMAYSDAPFQDNYTAAVLAPFNRRGGQQQAEFTGVFSSAQMLGQLRTQKTAPQVDVVIMDTTTAAIACAERLVEPMTPATLPVLAELDPMAVSTGNGCGPGVTFDHLIIAYDAKAVTPAPTSLRAMADPRWRGKVGISAPPNIQGLALTAILAHAETGDWKNANGAFRTLREWAPQVQSFDPQPDGYTLILNDTLTFATGWNARAQLNRDRSGGRLGVMLPGEGTVLQINTINLVKGAPHRDAGLAFMTYALQPEAQKAFTERMFYGPTNLRAEISPEAARRTASAPEYRGRVIPVDWNEMVKLRDAWNQRWRREVIAASGR